jgi:hypothetical protein
LYEQLTVPSAAPIDPEYWDRSPYQPTPSILDAARELYETHDVTAISHAEAHNLGATVDAVVDLIAQCRKTSSRAITFITGAPGSGKTLAGLQIAHDSRLASDSQTEAVFLSGNRPLVEVLSQALAASGATASHDAKERWRKISAFVQHAYAFRNEYAADPSRIPSEHIVLFDEAQRAWDSARVSSKTKRQLTTSEPEILLSVMSRVSGWCVVIAMVGGGQEINRGEAGLAEWGRSLAMNFPSWQVHASPEVLPGAPDRPGGLLFNTLPPSPSVNADPRLHLAMNVRSPRAERLNQWVDAVLALDLDAAKRLIPDSREFPIAVTRDIRAAKSWLKDHGDEDYRYGLVASADGKRLRAWGFDTTVLLRDAAWPDWFLRPLGDVRSSYQLEVPATSFDCQGLELDWVGVCWSNDLAVEKGNWRMRQFRGAKWVKANAQRAQYILNGYRVLLTRARRGQVVWVPAPDGSDATLEPELFDGIADLLLIAGAQSID